MPAHSAFHLEAEAQCPRRPIRSRFASLRLANGMSIWVDTQLLHYLVEDEASHDAPSLGDPQISLWRRLACIQQSRIARISWVP